MSPRQVVVHYLYDELSIVLGRAELLGIVAREETSVESAAVIRGAALNIQKLLAQLEE